MLPISSSPHPNIRQFLNNVINSNYLAPNQWQLLSGSPNERRWLNDGIIGLSMLCLFKQAPFWYSDDLWSKHVIETDEFQILRWCTSDSTCVLLATLFTISLNTTCLHEKFTTRLHNEPLLDWNPDCFCPYNDQIASQSLHWDRHNNLTIIAE